MDADVQGTTSVFVRRGRGIVAHNPHHTVPWIRNARNGTQSTNVCACFCNLKERKGIVLVSGCSLDWLCSLPTTPTPTPPTTPTRTSPHRLSQPIPRPHPPPPEPRTPMHSTPVVLFKVLIAPAIFARHQKTGRRTPRHPAVSREKMKAFLQRLVL